MLHIILEKTATMSESLNMWHSRWLGSITDTLMGLLTPGKKTSLYTTTYLCDFTRFRCGQKRSYFNYPHRLKWCGKPPVHLGRGNIYSSPTNSPLPLCGFCQERGTLSTSDSTPARASLQILYVRWMMVITVKGLGYYLFLSSRQHLTVFVYQVVIKILCLDVKLTYFITNLLLQLIMNYV